MKLLTSYEAIYPKTRVTGCGGDKKCWSKILANRVDGVNEMGLSCKFQFHSMIITLVGEGINSQLTGEREDSLPLINGHV